VDEFVWNYSENLELADAGGGIGRQLAECRVERAKPIGVAPTVNLPTTANSFNRNHSFTSNNSRPPLLRFPAQNNFGNFCISAALPPARGFGHLRHCQPQVRRSQNISADGFSVRFRGGLRRRSAGVSYAANTQLWKPTCTPANARSTLDLRSRSRRTPVASSLSGLSEYWILGCGTAKDWPGIRARIRGSPMPASNPTRRVGCRQRTNCMVCPRRCLPAGGGNECGESFDLTVSLSVLEHVSISTHSCARA